MKMTILLLFTCLPILHAQVMQAELNRIRADRSVYHQFSNPDWSEGGADKLSAFYAEKLTALADYSFDELSPGDRVDYVLLRSMLEQERLALARDQKQLAEDLPFLPFWSAIVVLETRRQKVEPLSESDAAKQLGEAVATLKKLQEKLAKASKKPEDDQPAEDPEINESKVTVPTPVAALRLARRTNDAKRRLEGWYKHYLAYRPGFEWWMKKPVDEANKALDGYAEFLKETVAGIKDEKDAPLLGTPVGEAALNELLQGEFIPYAPQELLAIGEREYAWCENEMKKAAKEMGFDQWMDALEKIKSIHVKPGKQDALVAQYGQEALAFVTENELLTVPDLCRDFWDVKMIELKQQKQTPYALYGGSKVVVAYAANNMAHEEKMMSMRGNNLHTTRLVVAHELIPGHHLQHFMAQRYNPHRRSFSTPFFVEGWALYWEIRLWDLGYPRGPEDRVGMLFWRMHRCARIIVTMKYHLGEMTPDEMVTFLVDRVGHEKDQATSEVRRYIGDGFNPLYQAAYMIGGLQLMQLHAELVPKKMTEKEFHDAVLKLGPIPVELMRAQLLKLPLTRDYQTQWKFTPVP